MWIRSNVNIHPGNNNDYLRNNCPTTKITRDEEKLATNPVKTENFNLRKASWCGYQFSPAYFGDNTCAIY